MCRITGFQGRTLSIRHSNAVIPRRPALVPNLRLLFVMSLSSPVYADAYSRGKDSMEAS